MSGSNAARQDDAPRFCITLVHGTFARAAQWTKEGSALRKGLETHLGQSVQFNAFEWSGENSHTARRAAGIELQKHLQATRRRFPNALHVVIGHSHGGTVALYARKADGRAFPCSDGIVTIATPYLSFRPRRTPWYLAPAMGWVWGPFASLAAAPVLLPATFVIDWVIAWAANTSFSVESPAVLAGVFAYFATAMTAVWFAFRLFVMVIDDHLRPHYRRVRIAIAHRQNAHVERGPWPIPGTRVLNLQVTFDEASWYLRALDQVTNVCHLVCSVLAYLLVTAVIVAWNAVRNGANDGGLVGILLVLVGPVLLSLLLCTVVLVLHGSVLLLASAMNGNRFGFGYSSFVESFMESFLVRVSAGSKPHPDAGYHQRTDEEVSIPYPLGGWLVHRLVQPPERSMPEILPRVPPEAPAPEITNLKVASLRTNPWRSLSLRHSTLYATDELIEMIAGWMMLVAHRREVNSPSAVLSSLPAAR